MGIFKGSATVSRYKVSGQAPPDFAEFVDRRIRANVLAPIDQTTDEAAVGWCSVHDYLDLGFAYASYALEPYIVLGMRVDQRKLSLAMLRRELRQEINQAITARDGRPIGRHDREELKEKVRLDLLRRIPLTTHVYELVWDTNRGEVWFGADGRGARDLVEDLFRRTFDPLALVPQVPYLLATALQPQFAAAIEALRPASLYRGEVQ